MEGRRAQLVIRSRHQTEKRATRDSTRTMHRPKPGGSPPPPDGHCPSILNARDLPSPASQFCLCCSRYCGLVSGTQGRYPCDQ